MQQRSTIRGSVIGFWALVLISLPIWIHFEIPGWDVRVYTSAIHSLQTGHDPYADAMSVQRAYHAQAVHPAGDPPWSYVYSPITLPLLRLIGRFPLWLAGAIYWIVFAGAVLAQVWVAMTATEPHERRYFPYLAPVAPFFPGFLANGIMIGGNIAYLLYAAVLLTAVFGWRRGRWLWFYLAVLVASCVKAPLLSLVVIPVLSARRQWLPAGVTTAVSLGLFGMQPLFWPTLFQHYLEAVRLQFDFNRDFGCSPSGLFGGFLYDRGIPYSPGTYIFYLAYAMPLFAVLLLLGRCFLRGDFPLTRWMPVLLTGVILLNPRILEYDVAPLALLLALIAWRFFAEFTSPRGTMLCLALLFALTNAIAAISWDIHKLVDGPLLVIFFAAGCWDLLRTSRNIAGNGSSALQ
jgi:MFS family permease